MPQPTDQIDVYLETGKSKTFAVALDWPGWARSGRDEPSALNALYDYGPRYARVLESTKLGFSAPSESTVLAVVERQPGTMTTNFGAPDLTIPRDFDPVSPADLERFEVILRACWSAVDAAIRAAAGKELTKGPRGGGRDVAGIVEHIQGGDASYLTALGGKLRLPKGIDMQDALAQTREAIMSTLAQSVRGEIAAIGPRGGQRWSPRYFVRRLAWHDLDHAWEIESRAI